MTTTQLSHPKYRPDIDGLRAIAVLSVVAFHAFPNWIAGGFIGVDIFFVISGYLISTIIFDNLDKGTFNLLEFYSRRIKRIFPAVILVLVASFAFGWFALLSDEYKQLGKHIAAGAGFVSNLVSWHESGYFDNVAETKPLLHLWTLGIEEQFYIVWPLLLWLAWKRKFNLLTITIFVSVLSFMLNVNGIRVDAVGTFFSPQTRFWELLSGSLLAWFTLYKKNILGSFRVKLDAWLVSILYIGKPKIKRGRTLSNILSFVGFSFLLYGFIQIKQDFSFPGFWALLPVIGCVLIIAVGSQAWINRKLLSNKFAVWFGLISFPLYLWHWPILTFARIVESETPNRSIKIVAIIFSVALAWLTYKFVEHPIRLDRHGYTKTIILVVIMVIVGLGGYDSYKNNRKSSGAAKAESISNQIGWTIPSGLPEQVSLCGKMFPKRSQLSQRERDDNFCILQRDSTPNILMVGDSLNLSLFPGLNKYDDINALLLSASMAAPFYDIRSLPLNDSIKLMNESLDYALNNDSIKVVIMSFLHGPWLTDPNHPYKLTNTLNPTDQNQRRIFSEALSSTLAKLLSKNKHIIYVFPNPDLTYDIKSCLNSYRSFRLTKSAKNICAGSFSDYLERGGREYREWVTSVLRDFPEVKIFDTANYVCDEEKCWGMKNGTVLYRDSSHLSADGSDFVAPFLASQIREGLK